MSVVRLDEYRTVNYTVISGSYAAFGNPLDKNWRAFCITNNTDGDMAFSLDGSTNNIFIPAFSFRLYDVSANAPTSEIIDNLVFALNSQFYIKFLTAPTEGNVYLEGIYAKG